MENYQKASVEKGNISDSNNRNEAGRDVIFKYSDESYIDKELQARQDNSSSGDCYRAITTPNQQNARPNGSISNAVH